jgi:hypothetical protein
LQDNATLVVQDKELFAFRQRRFIGRESIVLLALARRRATFLDRLLLSFSQSGGRGDAGVQSFGEADGRASMASDSGSMLDLRD